MNRKQEIVELVQSLDEVADKQFIIQIFTMIVRHIHNLKNLENKHE